MPAVPVTVSDRKIAIGRLAVAVTVVAWASFMTLTIFEQFIEGHAWNNRFRYEAGLYMAIITLLTITSTSFLICRLAFFYRSRAHHRAPRAALDQLLERAPSLTALVPSYQEDARIIRMTLLSAALQEYPDLRVVLLIDDPPNPTDARKKHLLEAARRLPSEIEALLGEPLGHIDATLESLEATVVTTGHAGPAELERLAEQYDYAARWLEDLAAAQDVTDHTERFFADHVLRILAHDLAVLGDALRAGAATDDRRDGPALTDARFLELCHRLRRTFSAQLTSFERKTYDSLSDAPNKAMNLNSYIGLMGRNYKDTMTPGGRALLPTAAEDYDLAVPHADYILTLDADSVLLPEYCARMVYLLEQAEHQKVAVAQTPYSAYPGSATRLERIAGAATDIQHIIHQGLTYYDATFWVGANAVLRKRALDEIVVKQHKGDWEVPQFIRDRTVIEDTDSTIDFGITGWSLVNYPERLSYSATPPDFGSLCIQRRRWADGGLIITPKLWRLSRARKQRGEPRRLSETLLRLGYLGSIGWTTACMIVVIAYPFNYTLLNPLVLVTALPYFFMMASDLKYCGYKRLDVLRIYGFNLILIPVNVSGVGNSLLQAITGEKVAFKRTPKTKNRTPSPLLFVLTPYLIVSLAAWTVVRDYHFHNWENLGFAAFNGVLAAYAIVAFIGLRNSLADIWVNVVGRLYKSVPVAPGTSEGQADEEVAVDWAAVIHYGTPGAGTRTSVPVPSASRRLEAAALSAPSPTLVPEPELTGS